MEQIKIAYEFKNQQLPIELNNLFKLNSDVHSHFTRNVAKDGFHVPKIYTTSFGEKSLKYSAAIIWNSFIKVHKVNNFKSIGALRHYIKNFFLSLYKDK